MGLTGPALTTALRAGPAALPPPPQPAAAPGGFGVFHLLLVALLAFLIGHFANIALPLLTEKLKQLQQQ